MAVAADGEEEIIHVGNATIDYMTASRCVPVCVLMCVRVSLFMCALCVVCICRMYLLSAFFAINVRVYVSLCVRVLCVSCGSHHLGAPFPWRLCRR